MDDNISGVGKKGEISAEEVLPTSPKMAIYTLGHSTHPLNEFVDLLKHYGITRLVDLRRFPMSRKNPQFQQEALKEALEKVKIECLWMGESLGGYRKGGYEEYMKTEGFQKGVEELIQLVEESRQPTAIMCAELLWFRCHRRFISSALVKRGLPVIHILDAKRTYEHAKSREKGNK